jgi:arsenical pump membrane protein
MTALTAVAILAITVTLALAQPVVRGVRIAPHGAAALGALACLVAGLVTPSQAIERLVFLLKPMTTLACLMTITIIASRAGMFRVLAWHIARAARGSGARLFRYLFFAGTVTGALFTNDSAVLIFTPLVLGLTAEIRDESWRPESRVAYCFSALYVANLVGLFLISNPINLVVADMFGTGFAEYAVWMAAPAIASMVITFLGLRWFFRKAIPSSFTMPQKVDGLAGGRPFTAVAALTLGATLLGFFTERLTGVDTAYVAIGGALLLAIAYRFMAAGQLRPVLREIGWDVIAFVAGIFIVAAAIRGAGVTAPIGDIIVATAHSGGGEHGATFMTAFLAAASSAVMNNHPVAQIMAFTIKDLPYQGVEQLVKVLAALIGGDLGPKMLPIGSLAALLWFRILRTNGVSVSYRQYVAIGVPVTVTAIFGAVAVLILEYELWLRFGLG